METNIENLKTNDQSIVDLTEDVATAKAETETIKGELETIKAEKATLETELGKIKADKTNLKQKSDPVDPEKDTKTVLGSNVANMFTESQKDALKYNKKDK